MTYYIKQIKSYIQPPALPGCSANPTPIEGYDWAPENQMGAIIEELYDKNLLNDPMNRLIFEEKYVEVYNGTCNNLGDGFIGQFEPIANLSAANPNPDDIIIATFSAKHINLDQASNVFEYLRKSFPNNKVVGLLDNFTLEFQDTAWISEYIENIKKNLLEEQIHDK